MCTVSECAPKVSVIVPVYNVEKYIYKCLASICGQSLKDIEIICVNDCTPDDSMKIVQDFAKVDKRIRILEMEKNGGQDIARSHAMKIARGEYIGFVDSDDYIDAYFCENLYDAAKKNNSDIVSCYAVVFDERCGKWMWRWGSEEYGEAKEYSNKEYIRYCVQNGSIWNRIFRHSFLKQSKIDFLQEIRYLGDTVFHTFAVAASSNICVIDYYGYAYILRKNSTMRTPLRSYYDAWFEAQNKQAECIISLELKNKDVYLHHLLKILTQYCNEGAHYFPDQRAIFEARIEDFKHKFLG